MKKIVITAGGTSEPIDNVRAITNFSSGRLGAEICAALLKQKAGEIEKIFYICSERAVPPPASPLVEVLHVGGAAELGERAGQVLRDNGVAVFIHCMAVSDYTTDYVTSAGLLSSEIAEKLGLSVGGATPLQKTIEDIIKKNTAVLSNNTKISSAEDDLIIKLRPTPKIISMIKAASPETFLVGFKLLSGVPKAELFSAGYALLKKNDCDLVVANDLKDIDGGLHKAVLIRPDGSFAEAGTKAELAGKIVDEAFNEREKVNPGLAARQ